jgi:hypothetical protein
MIVSYLVYSSTLMMEVTYSSEILVSFQRATRRSILEVRTVQVVLNQIADAFQLVSHSHYRLVLRRISYFD